MLVLKRMLADRLLLAGAFLVVLFSAMLVSGIPIYVNAVAQSGLRARLARAPYTDANVQASVYAAGDPRGSLDARVTGIARDVFSTTGVTVYRSGESESFDAGGHNVVFGFFDGIAAHAHLVSGRWPRSTGGVAEVALPAAAARELGLALGRTITARSRLERSHVVSARVVGTYRVEQPSSVYWWQETLATTGIDGNEHGPLVTTRSSFSDLAGQDVELRWRLHPDVRGLTIDQASELRRQLATLAPRLNEGRPEGRQFDLDTNLPATLASAAHSLHLARAGVLVPTIQLALLAIYGLLFTTGLLIERRSVVTESLRLRGATTAEIVGMALVEATLIALPAVALAPVLAAAALHALNHFGPLAGIGLRLSPQVSGSSYLLSAAAGIVCIAGLALPALRARGATVARERRRLPLAGLAQRLRLDLVLVVLAGIGYWQLRRYQSVLVSGRGGLGIDPFLVAAPALLLLAGALLSLRLVPFAASLVERRVGATRGLVGSLGLRQLARRPRAYARSVLLLVLAVAIGVFAATYDVTWHTSQVDRARYAAGADMLVQPSGASGAPPTIDLASSYRAVGVREALPVATDSFDLTQFGAESGNLVAFDARRAAGVVSARSDFASKPLAELMKPLAAGRGYLAALPLPGRPARVALTVRLTLVKPTVPVPDSRFGVAPSLFLYLEDGDGLLYLYRLSGVTSGTGRRFEIDLRHRLPSGELALPRAPLSVVGLEVDANVPPLVARRVDVDAGPLQVAGETGGWRHGAAGAQSALAGLHARVPPDRGGGHVRGSGGAVGDGRGRRDPRRPRHGVVRLGVRSAADRLVPAAAGARLAS